MAPVAGVTHDLTLEDRSAGTPKIGLMYPRGKNGERPFIIQDYRTLAPRQLTMGEITHAELPAEIEAIWYEEDWRAGLGGTNSRIDPKRIAKGYKIDCSTQGIITVARELQVTTIAAAATPAAYKPSGFAVVGTEVWAFMERDVFSWNYTNKNWDKGTAPVAAANIYRNGVAFGDYTIVPSWVAATDLPTRFIHKKDADANWTQGAAGTGTQVNGAKYFCKGKNSTGGDILWAGYVSRADATTGVNIIVSTSDTTLPLAPANWSSEIEIGDASSEITGLVQDGDTVLVLKTNGVWAYYADGTQENLTPEYEAMAHPDNFRGGFNWNGHILLPGGASGLFEITGGRLYDISLKLYAPEQTWLHGRVVAIGGNPTRVFILVQETASTKYHLLMAEWAEFEGEQDYRWHHVGAIAWTTGTTPLHSALMAEGVPSGANIHHRIWVGVESSGSNLLPYFYALTTDSEDLYSNDADMEVVTVADDRYFPNVDKRYSSIDFGTAQLGANDYWEVKYRVDGGSWTWVTGAQGTSKLTTNPQTLTFGAEVTGKKIELQLLPTVATTSQGPQITSIRIKAQVRVAAVKSLPVAAYLAAEQELLNGAIGGRPKLDLAQLESWNAGAPELVAKDARSTSYNVIFAPGTLNVREVAYERWRGPEYLITFLLLSV